MSKKKNSRYQKPETDKQSEYYKLNTKAVEDLVTANESNSPQVSEEELRAYRSGPRRRMPGWAKILFVKFWFAAATCFFFIWGLGGYLADLLDLLFVTGMALGMVTDLLTNPVLRFFERTPGANSRWMMIPRKGYISFPLNILYAYLVLFMVFMLYNGINLACLWLTGRENVIFLGVEPVLFGLFYLGFDLLFIQIKRRIAGHLQAAKRGVT